LSSASVPIEAVFHNWSDYEYQTICMLAPDKLNRISPIYDNYARLLNSDSEMNRKNKYRTYCSQVN